MRVRIDEVRSAETFRTRSTTNTPNTRGHDSYAIGRASATTIELTAQRKRNIALANRILHIAPKANATQTRRPAAEARRSVADCARSRSIGSSSIDHIATESGSARRATLAIIGEGWAINRFSSPRRDLIRLSTYSRRFSVLLRRVTDMLAPGFYHLDARAVPLLAHVRAEKRDHLCHS